MPTTRVSETKKRLQRDATRLAEETDAGQTVSDRRLAESLILYGERVGMPEALVLAAEILIRSPVETVNPTADREEAKRVQQLLDRANALRSGDKILDGLIERCSLSTESAPRAAASVSGAKQWVVFIDRGQHFRLHPDPEFAPHIAARIVAGADGDPMLGVTVRRIDLVREERWVHRSRVSAVWNSGIFQKAWDIRVFNLSGPNKLKVRIEVG